MATERIRLERLLAQLTEYDQSGPDPEGKGLASLLPYLRDVKGSDPLEGYEGDGSDLSPLQRLIWDYDRR